MSGTLTPSETSLRMSNFFRSSSIGWQKREGFAGTEGNLTRGRPAMQ